ncbi:gluconolactonase [Aureococcus anophagefferens]|nr:gluconolactonase [Aureococcus anophagefferens]
MELVGDEAKWDAIFASREAKLVASGFQWPEGPRWTKSKGLLFSDTISGKISWPGFQWPEGPRWTKSKGLLFSDTISGKMYRWDEATKTAVVFLDDAGGCPKANLVEGYECAAGQAEPGPNGLSREYPYVKKRKPSHNIAVCQHGARRLAQMDLNSREMTELVAYVDGKRLNGPNDAARAHDFIFTDPYYALLEQDRFYDHVYTEEKSELGFAGVWRHDAFVNVTRALVDDLERPNGLALIPRGDQLVVSDCCQGATPTCPAGEARWNVYDLSRDLWRATFVRRIDHADDVKEGCADGFVYHAWFHVLLASCPGGLCVVGLDEGAVVAKLRWGSVANVELGGGRGSRQRRPHRIKLNDEKPADVVLPRFPGAGPTRAPPPAAAVDGGKPAQELGMATWLLEPEFERYEETKERKLVFAAHDPSARNHVLALCDACDALGPCSYVDLSFCDFQDPDWHSRLLDGFGPFDGLVVGCSSNGREFELIATAKLEHRNAKTVMLAELGLGRPGVPRLAGLAEASAPDLILVTNERAEASVAARLDAVGRRKPGRPGGSGHLEKLRSSRTAELDRDAVRAAYNCARDAALARRAGGRRAPAADADHATGPWAVPGGAGDGAGGEAGPYDGLNFKVVV